MGAGDIRVVHRAHPHTHTHTHTHTHVLALLSHYFESVTHVYMSYSLSKVGVQGVVSFFHTQDLFSR